MNNSIWKKILELIKKTGDRCIVVDETGEDAFVIMGIKQYEELRANQSAERDLTEEELLDRINRDVTGSVESQVFSDISSEAEEDDDEDYYIEPV
ncbi:hypothetical protein HZB94_03445 [Candidatus Falkowbacteria bacterium]|nr:hypothetical protein [Candidatus Falkowbacteria bacterium]